MCEEPAVGVPAASAHPPACALCTALAQFRGGPRPVLGSATRRKQPRGALGAEVAPLSAPVTGRPSLGFTPCKMFETPP